MLHSPLLRRILLVLPLLLMLSVLTVSAQTEQNDPDPLRFEDQIASFKNWDSKNSFPEKAILFTGSSSARMWNTAESFPDYPVINRGFGGSHISDVQYFFDDVIAPYNPSVIVLYAGDNDVAAGKSTDQIVDDYKRLSEQIISQFPEISLLFVSIKPSSSRWSLWPQMMEVNNQIEQYSSGNKQLFYVDLATPLLTSDGTPDDSLFMDDLLHLNEAGYDRWNDAIAPVLDDIWNNRTQ